MNQQINLYQPMFRKQKVVFSAMTMLQVSGFFLVLMSAIYAYQLIKLAPYEEQLTTIDKELEQLNRQIESLEEKIDTGGSKLLLSEIAKLTTQLEQRELIAQILGSRSFGNAAGFSAYMESFARGHVEGTWLTNVNIKAGGSQLGLKGKTLSSELVPIYIQRLGEEERIKGSSFNVMEIARVEKEDGDIEINFLLRTN